MPKAKEKTIVKSETAPAIAYGKTAFDWATLPETSKIALAQRGLTHVLGNEVASKVTASKKLINTDGTPKHGDAELATIEHDAREAKIVAILSGDMSGRAGGARIETVMKEVALRVLGEKARALGKPLPRGKELEALTERYIAKNESAVRAEAQAIMSTKATLSDADLADLLS